MGSKGGGAEAKLPAWDFPAKPTNKPVRSNTSFLCSFPLHHSQSVSFLSDVPCLICFFSVFQTLLKHCVSIDVIKISVLLFSVRSTNITDLFLSPPLWNS